MTKIDAKDKDRLGARIDPEVWIRLDAAVSALKREARLRGDRTTKDVVIQEAITHYLDFLEKGGEDLAAMVEEILTIGTEKDRRLLKTHLSLELERVRAAAEKRQPKMGA